MQAHERSITDRMRGEVDNAVVTVDTRVNEAILSTMPILVKPRVNLAIKLVNGSPGMDHESFVLNRTRGISEFSEGL